MNEARSVFVHAATREEAIVAARVAVVASGRHPYMSPSFVEDPIEGDDEYEVVFQTMTFPKGQFVTYDERGQRYGNAGTKAFNS
jgi:hypothetical protein